MITLTTCYIHIIYQSVVQAQEVTVLNKLGLRPIFSVENSKLHIFRYFDQFSKPEDTFIIVTEHAAQRQVVKVNLTYNRS